MMNMGHVAQQDVEYYVLQQELEEIPEADQGRHQVMMNMGHVAQQDVGQV